MCLSSWLPRAVSRASVERSERRLRRRSPIRRSVIPPFGTITDTANLGWSAGAKATNHACGAAPSTPVCAVPVLPATATLSICAPVAVPCSTFSTIIAVTASAVDFVMHVFHGFASIVWITLPSTLVISLATCGSMIKPPFATPAATRAISSGVVNTSPWPMPASANRGLARTRWRGRCSRPRRGRGRVAARSARRPIPRRNRSSRARNRHPSRRRGARTSRCTTAMKLSVSVPPHVVAAEVVDRGVGARQRELR